MNQDFDFLSFLFWFSRGVYSGERDIVPTKIVHTMAYRLGYYNCLRDLKSVYQEQQKKGFTYDRSI